MIKCIFGSKETTEGKYAAQLTRSLQDIFPAAREKGAILGVEVTKDWQKIKVFISNEFSRERFKKHLNLEDKQDFTLTHGSYRDGECRAYEFTGAQKANLIDAVDTKLASLDERQR